MRELDETTAITAGGWDPRYAVTLVVAIDGDVGAALMDPNGDGGDIDLDQYHRGPDGLWVEGSSSGGAGDEGSSWSPELVAIFGRSAPGDELVVQYADRCSAVTATPDGWWLYVAATQDEIAMPQVVEVRPASGRGEP